MLVVALLSMLAGGRTCVDMEDYGGAAEPWLRTFLALENGIPSHDTFSRLFAKLDPAGLQKALLRLAQDWADRLGDVVAVDGKALRRSFEDASERSPTHFLFTVRGGVEADAGAYWRWTARSKRRSVRRKFIRAQRDDDFLLDMIRRIRKNE